MADYLKTSNHTDEPGHYGSVLGGVLGAVIGMFVCILALMLCSLFQVSSGVFFQLFTGLVIGWFYRLFHGRRSKLAAYAVVGIFSVLTSVLWVIAFLLLSAGISPARLSAKDWIRLWDIARELLLVCAGMGMAGFFFTRGTLLTYADWKKAPWHMAYSYAGGATYNLLPEKLPHKAPAYSFAVHSRFGPGTRIIVEGSCLRQMSPFRKDRVFSVCDIAGVVLGPSGGCNVLYDRNFQVLAKFAGSMEHADLLLAWLLWWGIPMDRVPDGWCSPAETEVSSDSKPVDFPTPHQQFTLRLKRSSRIGFKGIGWFLLVLGAALFLAMGFSALTVAERWAVTILGLAVMGMGSVYLRIGTVCRVEVDGEQMRVFSRFGRTAAFSVREVSSVSRSMGWIVLYDREFQTLAKLDSCLENLDRLKEYLAYYGVEI